MLIGWSVHHVDTGGERLPKVLAKLVMEYAAIPHYTFRFFTESSESRSVVNSFSKDGWDHLDSDPTELPDAGILVPTFGEAQVLTASLVDIRSRKTVHQWDIPKSLQDSLGMENWMTHPLMLKDSSLVFISNGILRLSKEGRMLWANRSSRFHHSIQRGLHDRIWTSLRLPAGKGLTVGKDTVMNDALGSVDIATGKLLWARSVADILERNGFSALLWVGPFESDVIHPKSCIRKLKWRLQALQIREEMFQKMSSFSFSRQLQTLGSSILDQVTSYCNALEFYGGQPLAS